jgi:hypothetical protein
MFLGIETERERAKFLADILGSLLTMNAYVHITGACHFLALPSL